MADPNGHCRSSGRKIALSRETERRAQAFLNFNNLKYTISKGTVLVVVCIAELLFTASAQAESKQPSITTTVLTAQRGTFDSRNHASHALPERLSTADVEALLEFLVRKPANDEVAVDELASLKNNAADALLGQTELPAGLLRAFEIAYADIAQGEIWREYIVQKIPELVERAAVAERNQGLEFLRECLRDTRYIYAGTALLGMQRLHERQGEWVSGREVGDAALRILRDESYGDASKVTALQILARHEPSLARVTAREWLHNEMLIMHRVSALATLGDIGEAADRATLGRYASSPELRLRTAARAALAKLKSQ